MNIKATIKRVISHASVYFTVLTALYAFLVMIVNVSEESTKLLASQLLFIFIFSLLAAGGGELLRLERPTAVIRVLMHYAILLFGFYTCFLLPMDMKGSQLFVGIFLFTLVYGIVMGIRAGIRARFRANTKSGEAYQKQYDRRAS